MMDRAEAIRRIKAALKRRTGRAWSVTGGTGTAYCWLHVASFPREQIDGWRMTDEHRAILGAIFSRDGSPAQCQCVQIDPQNWDHAIARAEGRADAASLYRAPDWD